MMALASLLASGLSRVGFRQRRIVPHEHRVGRFRVLVVAGIVRLAARGRIAHGGARAEAVEGPGARPGLLVLHMQRAPDDFALRLAAPGRRDLLDGPPDFELENRADRKRTGLDERVVALRIKPHRVQCHGAIALIAEGIGRADGRPPIHVLRDDDAAISIVARPSQSSRRK